jgi:HNH endonuclease
MTELSEAVHGRPRNGRIQAWLAQFLGDPCSCCGTVMHKDAGWNGPQAPSRDHRKPVARGGLDVMENIIILCRRCNGEKGMLDLDEFRAVRAGLACDLSERMNVERSIINNPKVPKGVRARLLEEQRRTYLQPRRWRRGPARRPYRSSVAPASPPG